jgi:hypothetical protein
MSPMRTVTGQVPVVSNPGPAPGSPATGASRRALLAAGAGAAAAAAAGCTSSPRTSAPEPAPSPGLRVGEHVDIRDYGAVPGGPDCTAAINQALARVGRARAGSARVRVPSGLWHVSGPLEFGAEGGEARSFALEGDAPCGGDGGGSVIHWAPGGSGYSVLNITGAGDVLVRNLNIGPQTAARASAGHVACTVTGCSWLRLENVNVYGTGAGSPAGGAARGLVVASNGSGSVHACDIEAQVTAFEMGGGATGCAVTSSLFQAVAGNGGACCLMRGGAGTMDLASVVTEGGDYGVQMITDGTSSPEFMFMNNVQVNDPGITAGDFANGSQVFANQFWATANDRGADLVHGLNFHPAFLGGAYFANVNIGAFGGHGVWIQGGTGYTFIGGNVGGCGKNAPGGYDGFHVASAVGQGVVTLQGVHFDTDPWTGLSSPPARSAVNVEPGAKNVVATGNFWKADGYGTGPTIGTLNAASNGNVAV